MQTLQVLGDVSSAPPARTLYDILLETARRHPASPAIDDGTRVLRYGEVLAAVHERAARLAARGVRRGDRVGIRLPSGDAELYLSILAVLAAGAAYVPVDADDPQERAQLVFAEAGVRLVLDGSPPDDLGSQGDASSQGVASSQRDVSAPVARLQRDASAPVPGPEPGDDAWIIFTSGSTGVPKGVAVTHRSAAAFVDAEARLFLRDRPIGPGDRVLAGLSVAFDASCEEMWLAWRHGACLVPAPRSLVRSGVDLGLWLQEQHITVVSTVPTLAALWPQESLDEVRLLIFGGEACPPELAERVVDSAREVWNTYGPTEATVVACGARLTEDGPVRIGLPLDGWELAVLDAAGQPVAVGETGELIIGGVGLARYLDADKDSERFAPMPSLGWDRAYRSGDLVQFDPDGLLFAGRADDQVKLGGRRIELGEVDAALQALPGVAGAAAAVRRAALGDVLVGYLVADPVMAAGGVELDLAAARARLRESLPAALVPLLAVVGQLPVRTSGKIDRDALPWPLELGADVEPHELTGTAGWVADRASQVLAAPITTVDDDFFAHGGGSLPAARLVSLLRERYPRVTVADVYRLPRIGDLVDYLDESQPIAITDAPSPHHVRPTGRAAQLVQLGVTVLTATLSGLSWLVALLTLNNVLAWFAPQPWAPRTSWWLVGAGALLFVSPAGRMALSVLCARALLRGLEPGTYPRGGSVHLRLWAAERIADAVGAVSLAGAPWIIYYARALGAKVGRDVDLHSVPPVTGLITLGRGAAIEPEVDLSGYWLDGDELHVGHVRVGAEASVAARSTLGPEADVGRGAMIEAGSWVSGVVPAGELWAGSPATPVGRAHREGPSEPAPRRRRWLYAYGAASIAFALLPLIAALPSMAYVGVEVRHARGLGAAVRAALLATPLATVLWLLCYAALTIVIVRLLALRLRAGFHPVRSRIGWQAWGTERLMDAARTLLFPLYSSLLTPWWLRALGATIGRRVEASTVLALPAMTTVNDGAFLADDTMVASYELGGGWLHIEPVKIGKRAFLGNSGMVAPGRALPKNALVAVLSAAPGRSKKGSSWLGSPPVALRRRAGSVDRTRTFAPPRRLIIARALIELCRLVPTACTVAIGIGVLGGEQWLLERGGVGLAVLAGGLVLLVAGLVAGVLTALAKWVLVGRVGAHDHPLWSSFVWRNEVVDTFVEMVAAPWFARAATGTSVLVVWLRMLGARIGRGVWCESYWLPEADLVTLGDGATVNRGCVLQTHLFHDRIMQLDTVVLDAGATLGPHGVILPAASIGAGASVGPASLVMRGESVPPASRWIGNPIAPWLQWLPETSAVEQPA